MSCRALMFQGTGSDVGKSTIVAGICRLAKRRNLNVAPFKPQNMSNNAAVCPDGGEIGRAQALQARAAGLAPHVDMNPVLLKPQSDRTAQVVVHGQVLDTHSASDYMKNTRGHLLDAVMQSFAGLARRHELILVEGAGSPAEINLRDRDIANMGFATAAKVPVCLIGDIDRGGVIAAITGTRQVLPPDDRAMISSFLINRFRGDPTLFTDGVSAIEEMTGWPCRGVVPWLPGASRLPQEDAVVLEQNSTPDRRTSAKLKVVVPMLSRIANFDDMDPLRAEPGVELIFVPPGKTIPLDADAVVIPGTKSTLGDLDFLRAQGWDHDILALARAGCRILGICGGYQLLGGHIRDPDAIEGPAHSDVGLSLLDVDTTMHRHKQTRISDGVCARSGATLEGYEIHIGQTDGPDCARPIAMLSGKPDGARNPAGNVEGTYLHGLFANDAFRASWLESVARGSASALDYQASVEAELDNLADHLEKAIDIDSLLLDATTVGC
jgi:adenosylcobyric acid synthase